MKVFVNGNLISSTVRDTTKLDFILAQSIVSNAMMIGIETYTGISETSSQIFPITTVTAIFAPFLTSIDPDKEIGTGDEITIKGENFTSASQVFLGGLLPASDITFVSSDTLTIKNPNVTLGVVEDVAVVTTEGRCLMKRAYQH